jgi:hypothetical protein
MLNYGIIIFIIKYLVCLGLFYYTIKTKRTEFLYKAIGITFIAISLMIIVNFLLLTFNYIKSEVPFYYSNFIDFVSIVLIVNMFLYKKKAK